MAKPEIRLKGFDGEWEKFVLSQIFQERHVISTITPTLPQLSFTIEEGVIKPENRKSNKRDFLIKDKTNKKYLVTLLNDIIYNPANVIHGAIHKNSLCNGVVSPIYKIFYTDQNANFLDCIVRRKNFIKEISKYMEGTVLKLRTLKPESFLKMSIYIGSVNEQIVIADYFKSLDTMLQSTTKKIESLKQMKQACLVSMFPQAGETTPRVRFKGFEGEWELVKLDKLCEKVTRKASANSKAPVMMISASSGFINQSEKYSTDNAGQSLAKYTLLYRGEIAYNHGASKIRKYGSCFALDRKEARVPFVYHTFKFLNDDSNFFAYYLNSGIFDSELRKVVSSTVRMDGLLNISYEAYMDLNVYRPDYYEQQRIASYFRSLDKQISLQEKRLEKLKQIKAACLDKMFV